MSDPSSPTLLRNRKKRRSQNRQNWIDVKRKTLVNQGKEHITRKGRVVRAKRMGAACSCKLECGNKFSETERSEIFDDFWGLGDREKQWLFAVNHTVKYPKRRTTRDEMKINRQFSYKYYLPKTESEDLANAKIKVCKTMFLNTLAINGILVVTAWQKYDESGVIQKDMRGRHRNRRTVISNEMVRSVCAHARFCRDSLRYRKLNFIQLFEVYRKWSDLGKYRDKATTVRQYRDIVNNHISHPRKT